MNQTKILQMPPTTTTTHNNQHMFTTRMSWAISHRRMPFVHLTKTPAPHYSQQLLTTMRSMLRYPIVSTTYKTRTLQLKKTWMNDMTHSSDPSSILVANDMMSFFHHWPKCTSKHNDTPRDTYCWVHSTLQNHPLLGVPKHKVFLDQHPETHL